MRGKFFVAACLVFVVAACAQFPAAPGLSDSMSAQLLGPPLETFVAEGRLALYQGGRQDHVRFRWQHAAAEDVVLFLSPLGQGIAEIRRDAMSARLTQPNQPIVEANSLPELALRVFGTALPLDSLADWLRGARPQLHGEVDGWHVRVTDTMPHPKGAFQERPCTSYGQPQGCTAYHQGRLLRTLIVTREEVTLKLIVDSWATDDE